MIYIKIPQGWVFDCQIVNGAMKDVLVREHKVKENLQTHNRRECKDAKLSASNDAVASEDLIIIQDLVKECLRTKKRGNKSVSLNNKETCNYEIVIYFRKPPETSELFLKYEPNNNGKEASNNAIMVMGIDERKFSFANTSYTGTLWFRNLPLSDERLAQLNEKAKEQRDNRRHVGNNPLAT